MEDIIEIFFAAIVIIIGSAVSLAKNKKKAAARTTHPYAAPQEEKASPAKPAPEQKPIQPAAAVKEVPKPLEPTVHTHLQPDCETHDQPGSLGTISTEGKDPCHEEQLASMRTPESASAPAQGGLQLNWTGENLVKAFVMQEVLTRPSQRRRA